MSVTDHTTPLTPPHTTTPGVLRRHGPSLAALAAAYLTHQIVFRALAGIRFDTDTAPLWQILHPQWLREHLWAALFDLHSQPPLYNLVVGLLLELPTALYTPACHVLHQILAGGALLALYALAMLAGLSRRLSAGLTLFFLWMPAFVLYQNWISNTFFLMTLSTAAMAAFAWYVRTSRLLALHATAAGLFLLCMTRPIYHPLWFVGGLVLLRQAGPLRRGRFWLGVAPYLVLVGAWMAKNAVLVGQFRMSTWQGINLAAGLPKRLTPADLEALAVRGDATRILARNPWGPFDRYRDLVHFTPPPAAASAERPWLAAETRPDGAANLNFVGYPLVSAAYQRAVLDLVRTRPEIYFDKMVDNYVRGLCRSSHVYRPFLEPNERLLYRYGDTFAELVEGNIIGRTLAISFRDTYLEINLYTLLLPVGGVGLAVLAWRRRRRGDRSWTLVAAIGWTLGFQVAAIVLIDGAEGNRMRFEFEPLLLVSAALLGTAFVEWLRAATCPLRAARRRRTRGSRCCRL